MSPGKGAPKLPRPERAESGPGARQKRLSPHWLRSDRAADINVAIMRTFVRLRKVLATNEELARKVAQHDREIAVLFEHVKALLAAPEPPKRHPIGF